MKKIFCIIALSAICYGAVSQNNITWKALDPKTEKYGFSNFIKVSEDGYRAVFTISENKPFKATKHSIFLREYDGDMANQGEKGIPDESPALLSIYGFCDNTVISGNMDDSPFRRYGKESRLLISDANGELIVNEVFRLHGKRHIFTGIPQVILSSDSSHLIVVSCEQCIPDKPSLKEDRILRCINVYDKSLKQVWNDTIDFWKVFGVINGIDHSDYDFIDGKLLLIATNPNIVTKKLTASIKVVEFDQPGSSKMILNEKLLYPDIHLTMLNGRDGKIYLAGINNKGKNKRLVFISQELGSTGSPSVKNYDINKIFLAKYPAFSKYLKEGLSAPDAFLKMDDGLMYISEYSYAITNSKTGSTTYYKKHIALIKFDFDGSIKWVNMINKYTASKMSGWDHNCNAFIVNNKIYVFYSDYMDNIKSPTYSQKLRFVGEDKLWMAVATIDADGKIEKNPLNNIGLSKVRPCIPEIQQIAPGKFFMTGSQSEGFAKIRYFYGFYNTD